MSTPTTIPSQKRKGGRAPLPEVEENFTRLPPGSGDRTERAVCKHCSFERSWHTTELVKHLDKCVQYTPSKRQKYTRPWRIEPGQGKTCGSKQAGQNTPNGTVDNERSGLAEPSNSFPPGAGRLQGGATDESRLPPRNAEEQDGQQVRPLRLDSPSHSVFINTPTSGPRTSQLQPGTNPIPVARPPPIDDPDPRLREFIDFERGSIAWQNRPDDLDAIEAWLQYHRFDLEDITEISEMRWTDSWQLKLGDLYRMKRHVNTFKIYAAR